MHTTPIRRLSRSSAAPVFPALFAFALLFQVGTMGRARAESSPKTAVVLDPKVEGPIIPQDLAEIEKAVQAELQQQQFQVTSKGERDGIMSSTGNLKGCYRNDCLEQLGRLLGAHIVLAYKIKVQIVEVNRTETPDVDAFQKATRSAANGVLLLVYRDGATIYMSLTK